MASGAVRERASTLTLSRATPSWSTGAVHDDRLGNLQVATRTGDSGAVAVACAIPAPVSESATAATARPVALRRTFFKANSCERRWCGLPDTPPERANGGVASSVCIGGTTWHLKTQRTPRHSPWLSRINRQCGHSSPVLEGRGATLVAGFRGPVYSASVSTLIS